jgi:glycosyltransferase involved in cell wall biosynthesis
LEAAASSKAVVSTTIGAEGLDFEHGKEIVIADQPEAFAREITALLHNPERLRRIGEAARRKVVARYSYTTLKIAVDQALSSLTRRVPPLESIPDVLR